MTKPWLAYVICDARRTVTRRANVGGQTGAKVRKVLASVMAKNPVFKLPVRENVFGNQPAPNPVTRQLPGNHLIHSIRRDALGRNGHRWGRLAIVVDGVTTIQGVWESHTQGEGPEASSFRFGHIRRC